MSQNRDNTSPEEPTREENGPLGNGKKGREAKEAGDKMQRDIIQRDVIQRGVTIYHARSESVQIDWQDFLEHQLYRNREGQKGGRNPGLTALRAKAL